MSIASFIELLGRARREGYAIGYFESWDTYSLEAVIETAEEMRSPAILGFGGAVADPLWLDDYGVEELAGLARGLAEHSKVPTAVLFNEAQTLEQVQRGLRAGCNAVMQDTSHLPFAENLAATCKVVELAHACNAAVEAELGHLADASNPNTQARGTDPHEAEQFVSESQVDALAVSVGNVHVLSTGTATIDLERLERLSRAISVPLVIHGGTGFPAQTVPAVIARGVCKFNVGTRLKRAYLDGIHEAITAIADPTDIHALIASRKPVDIFVRGKAKLIQEIRSLMVLYDSAGRVQ